MYITDPNAALVVAHGHLRTIRTESAAERLRRASARGCSLVELVRRLVDRLSPTPLARQAASRP